MAFTFINKLKKVGALFEDLECGSDGSLSLSAYLHLPVDPGDPGPHPIFALPPLCDLRLCCVQGTAWAERMNKKCLPPSKNLQSRAERKRERDSTRKKIET